MQRTLEKNFNRLLKRREEIGGWLLGALDPAGAREKAHPRGKAKDAGSAD